MAILGDAVTECIERSGGTGAKEESQYLPGYLHT